jgi:hypothetical protein
MSSSSLNKKRKELRSLQPFLVRSKTRSRVKSRNSKRSRSKSRSKSLPSCRPVVYCGKNSLSLSKNESTKYDKVGKRDECFKKGIGIGMMIEMEKIKKKLLSKGIVLVLPKNKMETCIDKNGNIKEQFKKQK